MRSLAVESNGRGRRRFSETRVTMVALRINDSQQRTTGLSKIGRASRTSLFGNAKVTIAQFHSSGILGGGSDKTEAVPVSYPFVAGDGRPNNRGEISVAGFFLTNRSGDLSPGRAQMGNRRHVKPRGKGSRGGVTRRADGITSIIMDRAPFRVDRTKSRHRAAAIGSSRRKTFPGRIVKTLNW